jgi:hypothetical protein
VYQAKNDTRHARAQPNHGESQSYRSIDARKFASNCHCWRRLSKSVIRFSPGVNGSGLFFRFQSIILSG